MSSKKKKLPIGKIIIWVTIAAFLSTTLLPLFAFDFNFGDKKHLSRSEKEDLLNDLNKKKSNISEKLKEARLKENFANQKLREIQTRLSSAQSRLRTNHKYLSVNQSAYNKTKKRLDEIKAQQKVLEQDAKSRILAIYKNQRVKLIDGLLKSQSITDFMDHVHYQKRVISYDKRVLEALMDQSENIKKYNATLQQEAQKIQQITSQLRGIEREIAAEKSNQKTVVSKLSQERQYFEQSERELEKDSIKLIYKISELSGDKQDNPDATGNFIYPIKARITSPYGPRRHPIFGVRSMHSGIDLAAPNGTPVKASEGGLVIYSGWYGGYGRVVIVDHSKGYTTLYAHLSSTKVKVGDRVKQGSTLGYEGQTGYATGPHLHFEVRSKGKPQNPTYYLDS